MADNDRDLDTSAQPGPAGARGRRGADTTANEGDDRTTAQRRLDEANDGDVVLPNATLDPEPFYIVSGGNGIERVNVDDWQNVKESADVRFATPTEINQWHADNPDAEGVDVTPSEAS